MGIVLFWTQTLSFIFYPVIEFYLSCFIRRSFTSHLFLNLSYWDLKGITVKQQIEISKFIQDCIIIDINDEIKQNVIILRKGSNLKLPDSIVLATARFLRLPLIISDTDFKSAGNSEIIIYE